MTKPCLDGMCNRTDGTVCPDDVCDRATGAYVQNYIAILKSSPGHLDGYELGIELCKEEFDEFMEFLENGGGWFEYKDPFGEPRMVNTARFDIIDFKPSRRNAANT